MPISSKLSWLWPYGLTVLLVGMATILTIFLAELFARTLFLLFYAVVLFSAWQGGLRAGLLAITLSVLGGWYFVLPPAFSAAVDLPGFIQIVGFVLVALLINLLMEIRTRAEAKAEVRASQAEEAQRLLNTLLAHVPEGITIAEGPPDFPIKATSAMAEQLLGRPPRSLLGLPARQYVESYSLFPIEGEGGRPTPEQMPLYRATHFGEVIKNEEWVFVQPDGSRRTLLVDANPIFGENGRIIGAINCWRDISEQKQLAAERQIAYAQLEAEQRRIRELHAETEQVRERLERILAGIIDDFVMYDNNWRYVYVNDRAAQTLGYTKEQLIGQRIWDLFPDAVGNFFYQKVNQAVAEQREIVFEFYYDPFDRWFENRAYPIADGLLLFTADITERKQAEAALRESEARFRRMADSTPMMIWMSGSDKGSTYFNQAWLAFTGRSLEQELGFGWAEGVHPDDYDRCLEIYTTAFEAQEPFEMEYRLRRHDGEYRWIVDQATPLFEEDYFAGYIGSCFEIHERKRAELAERLLAETGKVLINSLDPATQLSSIAALAVPDLADWCAVDLYEEDWTVHHVAVAHVDPAKVELAHELQQRYPPRREELIQGNQPWQKGESQLYPEITEAMIEAGAQDAEHYQILRDLKLNSAIIVPLVARERVLGLMAFFWAESGRRYDEQDLTLAEELGRRAALALDNAHLYKAERGARQSAEQIAERLAGLQAVTAALSEALSPAQVASIITANGLPILGAAGGIVTRLNETGTELEILHLDSSSPQLMAPGQQSFPITMQSPLAEAVRTGEPDFIESQETLAKRYPSLIEPAISHNQAFVALPLSVEGRVIGAIGLSFAEPQRFNASEREFMMTLASQCAQALERARLYQEMQQLNAELEERVAQRTAELERLVQELDQFTYIASHDLKAPLRGVKQLSTWIVEDAGDLLPENSKVHLDKMQDRIQRMEKLLDDLLMYSRVGRNYYENVEIVDTGALVKEVIDILALPPDFTVIVQEGMPTLTTLRTPLELIFKNLIENAIKHHHQVDGRVQISARDWDNFVEFSIMDDGPGIDHRFHERIFQIFQTLQPGNKIESTGVGLAIVKKAVESQGGKITVTSVDGQGTTFRFTWPKAKISVSTSDFPFGQTDF